MPPLPPPLLAAGPVVKGIEPHSTTPSPLDTQHAPLNPMYSDDAELWGLCQGST